jgi:hypothetical protein
MDDKTPHVRGGPVPANVDLGNGSQRLELTERGPTAYRDFARTVAICLGDARAARRATLAGLGRAAAVVVVAVGLLIFRADGNAISLRAVSPFCGQSYSLK